MSRNETLVCFFPLKYSRHHSLKIFSLTFCGEHLKSLFMSFLFHNMNTFSWASLSPSILKANVRIQYKSTGGKRTPCQHGEMEQLCCRISPMKQARSRIRSSSNFKNVLYCFKVSGVFFLLYLTPRKMEAWLF